MDSRYFPSSYVHKGLSQKILKLYKLYQNGMIDEELEGAMELVENFLINQYNGRFVPPRQLASLAALMGRIRDNPLLPQPLAKLIHAAFVSRRGPIWEQEASAAFAAIHRDHPQFMPAYEKHLEFCERIGNKTEVQALLRIILGPEKEQFAEAGCWEELDTEWKKDTDPKSETKAKTATFNPVVGSGRPKCVMFGLQPAADEKLKTVKVLFERLSHHPGF